MDFAYERDPLFFSRSFLNMTKLMNWSIIGLYEKKEGIMKDLIKAMDNLPWIVKIILALPGIDGFAWGLYRLIKGIANNNMTLIIAGIVWILVG